MSSFETQSQRQARGRGAGTAAEAPVRKQKRQASRGVSYVPSDGSRTWGLVAHHASSQVKQHWWICRRIVEALMRHAAVSCDACLDCTLNFACSRRLRSSGDGATPCPAAKVAPGLLAPCRCGEGRTIVCACAGAGGASAFDQRILVVTSARVAILKGPGDTTERSFVAPSASPIFPVSRFAFFEIDANSGEKEPGAMPLSLA